MIFASSAASVSEVQPLKMSDCRSLPTVVSDWSHWQHLSPPSV